MIVPDVPLGSGINSLPIARFATERDEVAMTWQSVLAASGHFLLAAHNPPTSAVRALAVIGPYRYQPGFSAAHVEPCR